MYVCICYQNQRQDYGHISDIRSSITSKCKAGLTWALVRLRVAMWHRTPGVSSTLSSLGALRIGCPVVVGAPWGVRVPYRPGIITITSLEETERENVRDRRSREIQMKYGEREQRAASLVWSLFKENLTAVLKQYAFSNTWCRTVLLTRSC